MKNTDMPLWQQRAVIGDGDEGRGSILMGKVALWVAMARRKHLWPRDAPNMLAVTDALREELDELHNAALWNHPVEHQAAELLDLLAIALRALTGEHIGDKKARRQWLAVVAKILPTQPGEVGPWDEHKEGAQNGAA